MQNLGKNLTSTALSKSAMRRDCCRHKRNEMNKAQSQLQSASSVIWNYETSFKEIDEKIGCQDMNNPIFDRNSMHDYIEASFTENESIKKREMLFRKTK